MADAATWQVYDIEDDGTVCSRVVASRQVPSKDNTDYSRTCAHFSEGSRNRTRRCDRYVEQGSRYCKAHQPG